MLRVVFLLLLLVLLCEAFHRLLRAYPDVFNNRSPASGSYAANEVFDDSISYLTSIAKFLVENQTLAANEQLHQAALAAFVSTVPIKKKAKTNEISATAMEDEEKMDTSSSASSQQPGAAAAAASSSSSSSKSDSWLNSCKMLISLLGIEMTLEMDSIPVAVGVLEVMESVLALANSKARQHTTQQREANAEPRAIPETHSFDVYFLRLRLVLFVRNVSLAR